MSQCTPSTTIIKKEITKEKFSFCQVDLKLMRVLEFRDTHTRKISAMPAPGFHDRLYSEEQRRLGYGMRTHRTARGSGDTAESELCITKASRTPRRRRWMCHPHLQAARLLALL
jgi:hypothetical protein